MVRDINVNQRELGVSFSSNCAKVLLWAPKAQHVSLIVHAADGEQKIDMEAELHGYWSLSTNLLTAGTAYQFELSINGKYIRRADPASLAQPHGVHGISYAIDVSKFSFADQNWDGHSLNNYVIYELHVGTFSDSGDFDGVIKHLSHLQALGITAIELMPINTFPGYRNWGYDGVFPFAVQQTYGGCEGLAKLVSACHEFGIAVILDVVYNHFGPEGNYLEDFGNYLTGKYQTPWGKAVNYDDEYADGVRRFVIENALMWFRDFHIDALRLDAVHAIRDFSAVHILEELSIQVAQLNKINNKKHQLIIEFDLNDPRYVSSRGNGGLGMDAQWIDEFHHTLRVAAGQPQTGYYADFNGLEDLAKAYTGAYVYQGQYSKHRKRSFGKPANGYPGSSFVVFSQNHDQIGNRMLGERSSHLYGLQMQKVLFAAVMVSPFVPLLFMGEEWAAKSPFQYFVDHSEPALIEAVRKGRALEFKDFQDGEPPDPQDPATFKRSKLNWIELEEEAHQNVFRFYKAMISLRKSDPILASLNRERLNAKVIDHKCLMLQRWDDKNMLLCLMNFSTEIVDVALPIEKNGWKLVISSAAKEFGGLGSPVTINQKIELHPQSIIILRSNYV